MRSTRRDDGAAAVWAVSLTSLLLVAALVVAVVGDVLAARSRASAAADLAALAAAPLAASTSTACRRADEVARANGAQLVGCVIAGGEVEVLARVEVADPWRRWIRLLADGSAADVPARAGLR